MESRAISIFTRLEIGELGRGHTLVIPRFSCWTARNSLMDAPQ